jgi:hypothetical protein
MYEEETAALAAWIQQRPDEIVSSDLVRTELIRATRRIDTGLVPRSRAVLDSLTLLTLPAAVFERAALLDPVLVRSLDALHLAAALELGDDLESLVTYDGRQAAAAEALGIAVSAPT